MASRSRGLFGGRYDLLEISLTQHLWTERLQSPPSQLAALLAAGEEMRRMNNSLNSLALMRALQPLASVQRALQPLASVQRALQPLASVQRALQPYRPWSRMWRP